jgi:putative ABC transport system ATP-binding protein
MPEHIVSLTNIHKTFGHKEILRGVSLDIECGDMIAICGCSGSGKSTLLNIIGLLEPFDSGDYELFGQRNVKVNSRNAQRLIRKEIAYLFQNFALIDDRTVEYNLQIALSYVKESVRTKREMMQHALKKVGLEDYLDAKVYELSGGEQQRAAVARCALKPGRLVLADEPTGSLDAENRDSIINLLKDLNQSGKTLAIVTHDPVVAASCNCIIDLEKSQTAKTA